MKLTTTSRYVYEIVFACIALSAFMTILQTDNLGYYIRTYFLFKVFVLASIPVIGLWMIISVRDYLHHRGIFYAVVQKFKATRIPKAAKYVIVLVITGNLMAIALGKSWYPFTDVGMFRWSTPYPKYNKMMRQHKYYYWENGQYKILDLRKEGSFFLAEHLGLRYTEEFMFSARFRNRGKKKNFEFLSDRMKERGIDTLWVGVHAVNFETREVSFDPDICRAVTMNETDSLYYGPIYIPDYQLSKCYED